MGNNPNLRLVSAISRWALICWHVDWCIVLMAHWLQSMCGKWRSWTKASATLATSWVATCCAWQTEVCLWLRWPRRRGLKLTSSRWVSAAHFADPISLFCAVSVVQRQNVCCSLWVYGVVGVLTAFSTWRWGAPPARGRESSGCRLRTQTLLTTCMLPSCSKCSCDLLVSLCACSYLCIV